MVCTLGVSMVMLEANICSDQKTEELQQACFEDIFWLPIYGVILSIVMTFVIFRYYNSKEEKTATNTR